MPKKKQVLENNEKFISFMVRLPSALKRKLEEHSAKVGQSQAAIIANLVADHIPDGRGISLAQIRFTEHDDQEDQTDLEQWLDQHAR